MPDTSIQTVKSTYSVDYIESIEKKTTFSGPHTTIGGYLFHNFKAIASALHRSERSLESTKVELILVRAMHACQRVINLKQFEQIRSISVTALPCVTALNKEQIEWHMKVDADDCTLKGFSAKLCAFKILLISKRLYAQSTRDEK